MKKKGFTLIELLAVIVILAIIAVIATPLVLNTIEDARKGAAKASVYTYVDEVEKQLVMSEMNSNGVEDGTYYVGDIEVSYKGEGPTQGQIVIEDKQVKSAKLCVNDYSIE